MGMFRKDVSNVLLVGGAEEMLAIFHDLTVRMSGLHVAGLFTDDDISSFPACPQFKGRVSEVISYLKDFSDISAVYCSLESMSAADGNELFGFCESHGISFCAVPARVNSFRRRMKVRRVGYSVVLSPDAEPLQGLCNKMLKRTFDIVFSFAFLFTIFPVVAFVVSLISKRKSPGPIFALTEREGSGGKRFTAYTFRCVESPQVACLPTFINVFFGSMSLVGPRSVVRPWAKPGITGWSQTHSLEEGSAECEHSDVWYIENWSLWLDFRIIIRCLFINKSKI